MGNLKPKCLHKFYANAEPEMTPCQILFHNKEFIKTHPLNFAGQSQPPIESASFNLPLKKARWPVVTGVVFTINSFGLYQQPFRFFKYYLLIVVILLFAFYLHLKSLHRRSRYYLLYDRVILFTVSLRQVSTSVTKTSHMKL